jgi:hypothetical protein
MQDTTDAGDPRNEIVFGTFPGRVSNGPHLMSGGMKLSDGIESRRADGINATYSRRMSALKFEI